jgi:hypothetical protein
VNVPFDFCKRAGTTSEFEFLKILPIAPEFGLVLNIPGQPKRRVGTDAAGAPMDNFTDARGRNAKIKSQPIGGQPQGLS